MFDRMPFWLVTPSGEIRIYVSGKDELPKLEDRLFATGAQAEAFCEKKSPKRG